MSFSLEFQKFFPITRTFFLTVGQNNFGNKIPFISGDDADIPEDPDEAFRKNAMKLTRIRAVEQVKKMVALVDDIAETTIKNSVLGEEMRTKSPLGMQMIMTKLSGRNTVGKDTNGKFVFCF